MPIPKAKGIMWRLYHVRFEGISVSVSASVKGAEGNG
jgi:hypothetical protein